MEAGDKIVSAEGAETPERASGWGAYLARMIDMRGWRRRQSTEAQKQEVAEELGFGEAEREETIAEVDEPEEMEPEGEVSAEGGNGWTFVLMSVGIGLIACCLLIPQADENRTLLYQCSKLKRDLEHIQKQAAVNEEFLKQINHDPAVAERLARLQMRYVRKGTGVLDLPELSESQEQRSPFKLVTVPPPPPLAEYQPVGGRLANLCRDVKTRLYMIGGGLMLLATGLVLGYTPKGE